MGTSPSSPAPRSWRDAAKSANKDRARPSRRRTFFWLAAAFLAVAGLFVVVITRIKPPPPKPDFVPLFITEHTSTGIYLPVNAQARGDLQAMVAGDSPCFGERAKILVPIQELKSLRRELDELKNSPPKDPVVVYLSGAVACDAEGKLYLLPGDADVDDDV